MMLKFKLKAIAFVAVSLGSFFAGVAQAQTIPGISDAEIRAFYATSPSQAKIDNMIRELQLTNTQVMRATEIGTGIDYKNVPAWITTGAYEQANHTTSTYARRDIAGQGKRDDSFYSPTLAREITPAEIAAFYATNPTAAQVLAKAAELGVSPVVIPNISAFGGSSGSGQSTGAQATDTQFLTMSDSLNRGTNGYAMNSAGQVVSSKDPGAMYSSDPIHNGLDRTFNKAEQTAVVENPAIPNKKWVNVTNR